MINKKAKSISYIIVPVIVICSGFNDTIDHYTENVDFSDSCVIVYNHTTKGIVMKPNYVDFWEFSFDPDRLKLTYVSQDYFPEKKEIYALEKKISEYYNSKVIQYNLNDSNYFRQYFGIKDTAGKKYIVCNINKMRNIYLINCQSIYSKELIKWPIDKPGYFFLYYYCINNDSLYIKGHNDKLKSISQ